MISLLLLRKQDSTTKIQTSKQAKTPTSHTELNTENATCHQGDSPISQARVLEDSALGSILSRPFTYFIHCTGASNFWPWFLPFYWILGLAFPLLSGNSSEKIIATNIYEMPTDVPSIVPSRSPQTLLVRGTYVSFYMVLAFDQSDYRKASFEKMWLY